MVRTSFRLRSNATRPDLAEALSVVSPRIERALWTAHEQLEALGVRHALVGGLAVGSHGAPRTTKDVDFVVGEEAFERHGPLVTFKAGIPIAVGDVPIDLLLAEEPNELHALGDATASQGILVTPLDALVVMKLHAGRTQDQADLERLIAAGGTFVEDLRAYVERTTPGKLGMFDRIAARAAAGPV